MAKILELVGGPPASGKSTYVRKTYGVDSRNFFHLDYDAMVVKDALSNRGGLNEIEIRDNVDMRYGPLRSSLMFGEHKRITVDWPFCISKRAEEYMRIGRRADREIECNFFTVHATEAWKRSLTRHVAGEYNAFTVFLPRDGDIGAALKPSFKMFLEAHRDMPSAVERIFPQADRANLWDNNQRDSEPVLIARCVKDGQIEVVDAAKWDRFQYKRGINIDADFEIMRSVEEVFAGTKRTLFDVNYTNLMQRGRERAEFLQRA